MYKDIELRIKYYTEQIIKEYVKHGIYPSNALIKKRLDDIETRTTIFRASNLNIAKGEYMDVKSFNDSLKEIYNDLLILYKTLEYITMTRYSNLNRYIMSHLSDLQERANMYLNKANLETYATSIGKTLIYKYKDFEVIKTSTSSMIDIGETEISDGTKIAILADIDDVDYKDVIFKLINTTTQESYNVNAYNYNHDIFKIPGSLEHKISNVNINESQKINGITELPIVIDSEDIIDYTTIAGKDKILYKKSSEDGDIIEETPITINSLNFDGHCYIDFYVVDGSYISFRFNKKPLATNFNVNASRIELSYIQHFFIECDEGFSFDFELEKGNVYAYMEKTILNNGKIYYSGAVDIHDFAIITSTPKQKQPYDILLLTDNISPEKINGVAVKDLGISW